jgi:ketosteroid isomerase-like protein
LSAAGSLGPNAERVRRAFEHWSRGEHEAVLAEAHPDLEIRVGSSEAFSGEPFRGRDGYYAWQASVKEAFERWEAEIETFYEQGHTVVALGQVNYTGRASGIEIEQETGWVIRFRDGKMWRLQAILSHADALAEGEIS